MNTINAIAKGTIDLINDVIVPLIFALAFMLFLLGVFRYLIADGDKPEKRKEGTKFIFAGLIAFAVMVSVWGLVRVFAGTFSLDSGARPCLPTFTGKACVNGGSSGGATNSAPTNILPPGYRESPQPGPQIPGTGLDGIY